MQAEGLPTGAAAHPHARTGTWSTSTRRWVLRSSERPFGDRSPSVCVCAATQICTVILLLNPCRYCVCVCLIYKRNVCAAHALRAEQDDRVDAYDGPGMCLYMCRAALAYVKLGTGVYFVCFMLGTCRMILACSFFCSCLFSFLSSSYISLFVKR